jgi:hypothetical protein
MTVLWIALIAWPLLSVAAGVAMGKYLRRRSP